MITKVSGGKSGQVRYHFSNADGCFRIDNATPGLGNDMNILTYGQHWKVIGNIYQNSELLEGQS